MYSDIYDLILSCGPRLVYGRAGIPEEAPSGVHAEGCINEKAAYEMALAGAYAGKRTACLFSVEGVYEALDPLMSSAYTGVKGGFVVVCVKEGTMDVAPLGPFSKLPVLVSDGNGDDLYGTLSFAFELSERYEMPCLVETLPLSGRPSKRRPRKASSGVSIFDKNPARWAAIPKHRFELHRALNDKIERIREELETYGAHSLVEGGKKGVITHRACAEDIPGGGSVLNLASVFPLPLGKVSAFIDAMDEVAVVEGAYPAIELQVRSEKLAGGRLRGCRAAQLRKGTVASRDASGFTVVRDDLGPASAIALAHGMAKGGMRDVLAVTTAGSFLHSGLPSLVNSLYNGSAYLLAIRTDGRREEIEAGLRGFGFDRFFSLSGAGELAKYRDEKRLTVLFFEGDL